MKKIFFVLTATCIVAASCQKNQTAVLNDESPAALTVSIANDLTKAAATPTSVESSIDASKVYLFVFKADGSREYGQAVTLTSGSTTVNLTAGAKTVWVVANCPSTVLEASDLSAFKSKVSALADNSAKFVMAGSECKTISGSDNVSIILKRLASKVCLVKFKRDFTDATYAASTFTLNRVYLSNVCGECHYFSDGNTMTSIAPAAVSNWYNRLGVYSLGGSDPVALLSASIGQSIVNGASYTTEQTMYAYPNACGTPDNHGSVWDMSTFPRHTRLVIDCSLAGTQGYYHVSLPVMDSNKIYNIELTVHKRPSDNPEDNDPEINPALAFTANVSVADWDTPISIVEAL